MDRTKRRSALDVIVWSVVGVLADDARGSWAHTRIRVQEALTHLVTLGIVVVAICLAVGFRLLRLPVVGRYLDRLVEPPPG